MSNEETKTGPALASLTVGDLERLCDALSEAGFCLVRQREMDAHHSALRVQRAMAGTVDAAVTSSVYGLTDDDVAELACKVAEVAREQADWLSAARDGLRPHRLTSDEGAALLAALTPVAS